MEEYFRIKKRYLNRLLKKVNVLNNRIINIQLGGALPNTINEIIDDNDYKIHIEEYHKKIRDSISVKIQELYLELSKARADTNAAQEELVKEKAAHDVTTASTQLSQAQVEKVEAERKAQVEKVEAERVSLETQNKKLKERILELTVEVNNQEEAIKTILDSAPSLQPPLEPPL